MEGDVFYPSNRFQSNGWDRARARLPYLIQSGESLNCQIVERPSPSEKARLQLNRKEKKVYDIMVLFYMFGRNRCVFRCVGNE